MENTCTKTSENQDLNDFLTRNIGLNSFLLGKINSQQQRIVSLSKKYAVSERVVVEVNYYSEVLTE